MRSNPATTFWPLLLLVGVLICRLSAAEFSAKITDGLGRPLPEATVEVDLAEKGPDGKVRKVQRLKLLADRAGLVNGRYDAKSVSTDEVSVYVSKEGYETYTTGLLKEYVLKREFRAKDIRRVSRLKGKAQQTELRELLAGEFQEDPKSERENFDEIIFFHEDNLRPALQALVSDVKVGTAAIQLLAFIGVPEDLRLLIRLAPPPKRKLFEDRWAYGVVSSLLEPATEEEWAFLRKCALNEYDDLWVDAGAINALKLIASAQCLAILQEVRKHNTDRERLIAKAIEYIASKPSPLADVDLAEAGKKVAQAIKIGSWEGNRAPRFNENEDMALIDCVFVAGRDELIYTATFHKVAGVWNLRGVRETMQALLANPPDRKAFIGVWHGYSDSHLEFARLELKEDGQGLFALSEIPNSSPSTYLIPQWSLQGQKLEIKVEPVKPEAELITLQKVTHGIGSLNLELHGRGWSRQMTLFNETELQNRAEAVKKSLEKLGKSN